MFIIELNYICDRCQNIGWYSVCTSTETSGSISSKKCEVCKDFIGEKSFSFEVSKELWAHFREEFFNNKNIKLRNEKVIKELFCSSSSVDAKPVKTNWKEIEELFNKNKE